MVKFKINKEFTIEYRAKGDTEGLTDLECIITKPDGYTDSLTFTEIGGGLYKATYTPTVAGLHRIEITSSSNGDKFVSNFLVVEVDISSKLDVNSAKLDAIQSDVTDIKNTQDTHTTKLNDISSKLDDIDSQIYPGGKILGW